MTAGAKELQGNQPSSSARRPAHVHLATMILKKPACLGRLLRRLRSLVLARRQLRLRMERASRESLALACRGRRDGTRGSSKGGYIRPGWDRVDSGSSMGTATANEQLVRTEMNAPTAMAIEPCRSLHTQTSNKQQAASNKVGRPPREITCRAAGGGLSVQNSGFRVGVLPMPLLTHKTTRRSRTL